MGLTLPVSKGTPLMPIDIYDCKLTGYDDTIISTYGPTIKLFFVVTGGDYKDCNIDGLASIPANGLTPKSKLRLWVEGIVGRQLAGVTEAVDLDKLIGRACRINLGLTDTGDFNRILGILPAKGNGKPAPAPAPVAAAAASEVDQDLGF